MVDSIDAEAEARGRSEAARANVVVVCRDAGSVQDAAGSAGAFSETGAPARIQVATRCDLAPSSRGLSTSSITGRGIAELRAAILESVAAVAPRSSPATTRLAVACEAARQSLAAAAAVVAQAATGGFVDESLLAADLRRAVAALADVTGAAIDSDLLDRIFSRHCIGK